MFVETIAATIICGYIIYKLEKIDSRQDSIELRLSLIESYLPKRKGDVQNHGIK